MVDPQFLSVAISVGNIRYNWTTINFTAPRILNMARALNPAMLRVGGTSGDYLSFNATTTEQNGKLHNLCLLGYRHFWERVKFRAIIIATKPIITPCLPCNVHTYLLDHSCSPISIHQITIYNREQHKLHHDANAVGCSEPLCEGRWLIFGLNALLRSPYPSGVWNSSNAREIISYSKSKNYNVQWELGNGKNYIHTYNRQISIILCSEPNQWKPAIAADARAKDFVILSEVLTEVKPLGIMTVGPDVTYGVFL